MHTENIIRLQIENILKHYKDAYWRKIVNVENIY